MTVKSDTQEKVIAEAVASLPDFSAQELLAHEDEEALVSAEVRLDAAVRRLFDAAFEWGDPETTGTFRGDGYRIQFAGPNMLSLVLG